MIDQPLVEEGLANSIGVSNFSAKQIDDLVKDSEITPAVNQIEMHPYLTQKELVTYCQTHKIAITAYSPLGTGVPKQPDAQQRPTLLQDAKVQKILTHSIVNSSVGSLSVFSSQIQTEEYSFVIK